MAEIAFPTGLTPESTSWRLRRGMLVNEGINGQITRIAQGVDRWECLVTMPQLTGEDARLMRSFLSRLTDVSNQALLEDYSYTFSGTAGLTPLVAGASQTGSSINIDGLPLSTTGVIKAGDRLGLTTYQVLEAAADADSDGAGAATVTLITPIRTSPADNSAVELDNPVGKFIIPEGFVEWMVSAPLEHKFSQPFVEAI